MNNKKVQAQMQIDVSFIGNTTKLVKELQSSFKSLDLSSNLTKQFEVGVSKGFKDLLSNLDKMSEGLSKKGLSTKQYTNFFDTMNTKIQESTKFLGGLKDKLTDIYSSEENKKAIKDLENYKKKLEEINKLASAQKASTTRRSTAIKKMEDETGVQYGISKRMLANVNARKQNKQDLTANQKEWMSLNGLDEKKLARVLELYKQITAQRNKIESQNEAAKKLTGQSTVSSSSDFLARQIGKTEGNVLSTESYKQAITQLSNFEGKITQLTNATDSFGAKFNDEVMPRAQQEAEKAAQASSTLKEVFAQFGIAFSAAAIANAFKDLAKSAFDFYKSLDSALNQIYVVSNLTSNSVNKLKADFINMAKETGMAIDDVTRAAVLFYQQGLNTDEVLIMTEVTSQFAKVAGIDAADAADKLTAAVNGYCLAAEDASEVADKFNKVAAVSAADINELSTAFSKAAAQANQAGVSMDNYLAYIATMEEATREAPENIGTSLKTIFSRMQQIKTGDNTEDNTDVNQVETALKSVGIALRDAKGELRDLEEIFDELGPKWDSLDRNTQAYLGTIIAGTRQQSRFITLMQNWDRVLDLSEESENSAGQQALMHAKAMESIESQMERFQVAWQEFISNLTNSDVIKGIIKTLTSLLNIFNNGNKPIALMAVAVGLLTTKLKGLETPLVKKGKEYGAALKALYSGAGNRRYVDKKGADGEIILSAQEQKDSDLSVNLEKQRQAQIELNSLITQEATLRKQLSGTGDNQKFTEEEIKKKQEEQEDVLNKIAQKKKEIRGLTEEQKTIENSPIMTKGEALTKTAGAAGIALTTLGMAISSVDANAGGLVSTFGTLATSIGQMATNPIGGAIGLAMTFVQLSQVISNWESNLEAKIKDAVTAVKESVEKLNNYTTGIKSTENLLKKYDKLQSKIYKTETEQKELNNIIQQLSDTYEIDTITDAYGNLHINIQEVNDALAEQRALRIEAAKELDKTEIESSYSATSGLFNSNTLEDYYTKLLSTSRSEYKKLLGGVEDGLNDESRRVTSSVAKSFSNNLQTSIMNEVQNNKFSYIGEGIGESLIKIEEGINDALNPEEWNELYDEIDYLQQNLDNMSFNDVQDNLDKFYDNWAGANDLTQEQWDLLVDSINNTVFENESLLNFYKMINDMGGKISGEYYDKQMDTIENKITELEKQTNVFEEHTGATAVGTGTAVGTMAAISAANIWHPGGWALAGITALTTLAAGIVSYNAANTEDAKVLKQQKKAIEELKKQKEEYLDTLVKEHQFTLFSREDAEAWYNAQAATAEMMQGLNTKTQSYLSTIESLYDMENMTKDQAVDYANVLSDVLPNLQGTDGNAQKTNILIKLMTERMDDDKPELKEKLQKVVDEAFNNLELPSGFTFTQIGDELDNISTDLRSMNSLIETFNDNGGLTLDEFKDLAKVLDGIDIEQLYAVSDLDNGVNYVDQYVNALKNLDLAFSKNNGMITANEDALKSLQNIQEVATQAKIAAMRNELIAKKTQVEAEIGYIDAQIAGVDAAISAVEAAAGSKLKASDIEDKANQATADSFKNTIDGLQQNYATDVQNMNTWTQAVLGDLDTATEAWGRYWKAVAGEGAEGLGDLRAKAESTLNNVKWEGVKQLNLKKYGNTLDANEQAELLEGLQDYRTKLESLKSKYQATLNVYDTQIGLLDSLKGADLSKFGLDGKDKGKEIEKYIGKLKEIYNILNRIQLLEHRLSTLDSYSEVATGERYGQLLSERIDYNEQLLDQYEFLTKEQKQFTNGYKDFIQSVDGLEGVFDFDKFGQIIINWDKYNSLQDEAIDGETTLKEKADNVYETYTSMFEDLQGYFDNTIKYYKAVIDLQQEMIDQYMSLQDKAADAIKEIYQKILDTKLDAIDQEKEALEELKEAREKARKDQENAKTISGLQTNIQRAMMDTSGASDTAFIKAQQDMNDKLEEIADDKYSEELDNIINRLDEEKDTLQEQFDELFDNQAWLYDNLDKNFMMNYDELEKLFTQTEEWNQASPLRQKQLVDEWSTAYHTYADKLQGGDKTIYNIWENIQSTKERIGTLDENLKSYISKGSIEIANTIAGWQSNASSSSGSGGSGGDGNSKSPGRVSLNPTPGDKKDSNNSNQSTGADAHPYKGGLASMVGSVVELDKSTTYATYGTVNDKNAGSYKSPGWYEQNVTVVDGPKWSDAAQAWLIKINGGNGLGTKWVKASADKYGQGLVRYFHDRRWGKSGTKYATGGFADFTGPAWLDGTPSKPEAVLNALQTEHFIKFTDTLDKMFAGGATANNTSSVSIDTISFNVESMSSAEDGEKAFNAFVDKFKEIGSQSGIKIDSFKNRL